MAVTLLIVITSSLLSFYKKSAIMSDLISFKALSILAIYLLDIAIIFSELLELIGTMICFFKKLLVIILSLSFFFFILFKTL